MRLRGRFWLDNRFINFFGQHEREQQVRVATVIGASVGLLFAIFNLLTEGMAVLGLIELAAVLLLVVPAFILSRQSRWSAVSESLLLLAAMIIFGALIVLGGVEGTGIFWVYTAPFLVFFLKGQHAGWRYCLGFLAGCAIYLGWLAPQLSFAHPYSTTESIHFVLSLAFYTVVAAAFNYVSGRKEQQLRAARDAADTALQQVRQSKEQIEAVSAAKTRLLAAASHDLRQPAHAIGLYVAQLETAPVSPELVAGLDASVRALQEMLDVFFDYSRLDMHSTPAQPRPMPLEPVFRQLRICFADLAAQKGLRLRVRQTRAWVQSDPVLLQRVLLNLLSNALRYTERGGILVGCRMRQGQPCIEVRDSGIGIAPEHHAQIFEEFFQVKNPARERALGLGLGLSMVQRSCALLRHPLTLRSELGRGSCFTLSLPPATSDTAAPPARSRLPAGPVAHA